MEISKEKFASIKETFSNLRCSVHYNNEPITAFCTEPNCSIGLMCQYCRRLDHASHEAAHASSILDFAEFSENLFERGYYYDHNKCLQLKPTLADYKRISALQKQFESEVEKNIAAMGKTLDAWKKEMIESLDQTVAALKLKMAKKISDANGINYAVVQMLGP